MTNTKREAARAKPQSGGGRQPAPEFPPAVSSRPLTTSAGNTISAHVAKQLRAIRFELLSPASAHLVWTEVLTEEERQQLGGDLNSAYYQYHGAVGIYTQARGVEPDFALVELPRSLAGSPSIRHAGSLKHWEGGQSAPWCRGGIETGGS